MTEREVEVETEPQVDRETGEILNEEEPELPTAAVLQDLRNGALLVELGDAIRECALAVITTASKGAVTLKLTFDPEGPDGIVVTDDIVTKIPRAAKPRTFRYVNKKGTLTDTHPDRLPLGPIREVPPAKTEVRKA